MSVSNYLDVSELDTYLKGNLPKREETKTIRKMLSTSTNGIEGLPYQFSESVDRRIDDNEEGVGRKYAEKIFSKMPLIFLTPCDPLFMEDFSDNDKTIMMNRLTGSIGDGDVLAMLSDSDQQRKYYSSEFNYSEYYNILNAMLTSVAVYLDIQNVKIPIDGDQKAIGEVDWGSELTSSFKSFYCSQNNLIFYIDSMNTVSESFSNTTTESSLSGMINGVSDAVNELRFLFGSGDSLASSLMSSGTEAMGKLSGGLSSLATGLAGGILGSVTENIPSFMDGGKIVFPKIWQDSSFDRSYQLDFKFRSPDHDSVSIFLNVLKPYCKLLALTIPRDLNHNPNLYRSPFIVRAACKGMFNIDMGMISSLSVSKGAECCWNDDGLPTQIDVSITIDDLYSSMHSDGFDNNIINNAGAILALVNNTAYQDYLANMAGVNIAEMEFGRKAVMMAYLLNNYINGGFGRIGRQLTQGISNRIYNLWRSI